MKLSRTERAKIKRAVYHRRRDDQFVSTTFLHRMVEISAARQLTFDDLVEFRQMSDRVWKMLLLHPRKGWTKALLIADKKLKFLINEAEKAAGPSKHITKDVFDQLCHHLRPVYPFC